MPGRLAFTSRLSTSVGDNATGLEQPPPSPAGNNLFSDTGELRWNLSQPGQGLVTVNTPRTKLLLGFADDKEVSFSGITLKPAKTMLGWCTIGITVRRGATLTNDCTALVVATGWWQNTGQTWNINQTSVGNQWGRAPVLTEVVPFTLTLPVPTNHVRVWALDPRGQRTASIPVTGDAQRSVIAASQSSGTLWYELEVGAWTSSSYQNWMRQYFGPTEQADVEVSGPTAMPDGDNVPNLLKYYLGLPGRKAAAPDLLPSASLTNIANSEYLALMLDRPKNQISVTAAALTSSSPGDWTQTVQALERVTDLGSTERRVFYDTVPVTEAEQRYLRLVLLEP